MTTHRFRSLLLVVMAVGLAVRIASIATAEECEIIDYEIGQISEDRCADITDAVNYRNVAKANAEGHWFQQFVLYGDNYEDTALHPPCRRTAAAGRRRRAGAAARQRDPLPGAHRRGSGRGGHPPMIWPRAISRTGRSWPSSPRT